MQKLQIDKEFMSLSVPASEDVLDNLELSLLQEGCLKPIVSWHGYILDGHKRYNICNYEGIEYDVTGVDYLTRNDAIINICIERLKTVKPITPMHRYLVGKWYRALKEKARYDRKVNKTGTAMLGDEYIPGTRLSMYLAKQVGLSFNTIQRYGVYAGVLERILSIEPDLFKALISENIFIKREEVIAISKVDDQELVKVCRQYMKQIRFRMREHSPHTKRRKGISGESGVDNIENDTLSVGVKEMPVIDPDRELRGLTFTVPMWISSISRAIDHTEIDKATIAAKTQLSDALEKMKEQINKTLEELK